MSIAFNCEHCGRKIEAPESAGGKWGKCPGCQKKVFVPRGQSDEELRLAPLDTEAERKKKQMLAEEVRLREDILSETEVPEEGVTGKGQQRSSKPAELGDAELTSAIIGYLRQMADGDLEAADAMASVIRPNSKRALKIIEHIGLSSIPEPELSDIPQQVLAGLIKTLRNKL